MRPIEDILRDRFFSSSPFVMQSQCKQVGRIITMKQQPTTNQPTNQPTNNHQTSSSNHQLTTINQQQPTTNQSYRTLVVTCVINARDDE